MTLVLNGVAAPVGGREPARLPRRAPPPLRPARPAGVQRRPPRRALLVHRRLELPRLAAWAAGSTSACSPSPPTSTPARSANLAGGVDLSPRRLGARRRGRLPRRAGRLAGGDRMIDPLTRWAAYGEKPDYAGLMTYAGLPYTEDPAELAGADVAIVGAPMDELTSDSPGHALRAARDPRRELRRRRASGGRRRRAARRPAGGGLRRRADPPRRPGALARGDPGDGRAGAGRGRDPGDPRRRPLDRRAGHPRRAPRSTGRSA